MVVGMDNSSRRFRNTAPVDRHSRYRQQGSSAARAKLRRSCFQPDLRFTMTIKSVHITNYYHRNSGGISTAYNKLLEGANRRKRYVRLVVTVEVSSVEEVGVFGRIYYVKAAVSPFFDKRYRVMWPGKTFIFDKSPIKAILRDE